MMSGKIGKCIIYLLIVLVIVIVVLVCIVKSKVNQFMMVSEGSPITSYANPKKALLVVDVQEGSCGKYSNNAYPDADQVITKINEIITQAQAQSMDVIYIKQEDKKGLLNYIIFGGKMTEGTDGTHLDSRLNVINDTAFVKNKQDSFTNTMFEEYLIKNEINELYIVGLDAYACIYKTALGGLNRGYNINIISDAIMTQSPDGVEGIVETYLKDGINVIKSQEFKK